MRRILLLTSFFALTPLLILFSILYFLFLSYNYDTGIKLHAQNPYKKVTFAALPTAENVLNDSIISKDARIDIIRKFFQQYNSPLGPFAEDVVEAADKYSLDFRLLPAIAMQESNLCRKIIKDSYNCWGFGIYGKKVTRFTSYSEAIDTVSKTLAKNYIGGGLETPEQIMTKYTPSNDGAWAFSVNHFMEKLQLEPPPSPSDESSQESS